MTDKRQTAIDIKGIERINAIRAMDTDKVGEEIKHILDYRRNLVSMASCDPNPAAEDSMNELLDFTDYIIMSLLGVKIKETNP